MEQIEHQVIFQPSGRRGYVVDGKTLLQAAQELGVSVQAACGGGKVCGKCRVVLEEGQFAKYGLLSAAAHLSAVTDDERRMLTPAELDAGYRLACHARVAGDVLVTVPEESRETDQVVLETGVQRVFHINPAVRHCRVSMSAPTLEDPVADRARLTDALRTQWGLEDLSVDYTVLKTLPQALRAGDWSVTATVWQDREIIRVRPGDARGPYGAALDIGTTTIAAYLCDLHTGEVLAQGSKMNPQITYGEDVLARISYAMLEDGGLETLQRAVIGAINELVAEMATDAGIGADQVDELVLVYNTAMHHIALGIDPSHVGRLPFVAAESASMDIKARELGIRINPAGNIHSLPVEAGFVGPDNVAVLVAEQPQQSDALRLIIDIGTNGEINLGNRGRLLSTSCATGPALEGAQIKFGMRAAPGAIERVRIDPGTWEPAFKVIGSDIWYPENTAPGAIGICGSGIIDVIAQMFKTGIILPSGRLNAALDTPRLRRSESGKLEYVLARAAETAIGRDIVVTQPDIRAVQLAKAAIYVGARYLLERYGAEAVDQVTLAGAFGSYIDRDNARLIGLFPDCPSHRVEAVGNAAGDGAKIALLDREKRDQAQALARQVEFVETAAEPDFQRRFLDAMSFPHAKDRFPSLEPLLAEIPVFDTKAGSRSR